MNVGQRIREAREELGMQRTVLARRLGVAPNTVWRWEAGDREPSMALLEKIARVLRTEPAELMRGPVPLAEPLPAGGIPKSLEELLERRGARTRHLADPELPSAIRRESPGDVIRIVDEVRAEVDAVGEDLARLRASTSNPQAMQLLNQALGQLWRAQIELGIRRERAPESEPAVEQAGQALAEDARALAGVG
jgi:transcriptional regulator with XRE-family HTH domain